jgi:hypothetical protein
MSKAMERDATSDSSSDRVQTEEDYSEEAKEEGQRIPGDPVDTHAYSDARLKELVPNDEMYSAMSNFLLGDPERQILDLNVDRLNQEGNDAKSAGESVVARTKYETAAKVELYKQDKKSLENFLELAQEVTDKTDEHFKLQRSLLENIDDALEVAQKYYHKVPGAMEG